MKKIKGKTHMKKGFTLAEALITLTIIGVVATITVPSIMTGYKQNQYRMGLKKAVKNLNEAISMNIAKGEKSALQTNATNTLYTYLQKNMDVMRSTTAASRNTNHSEFVTADGIRYEIPGTSHGAEFNNLVLGATANNNVLSGGRALASVKNTACGTYGLNVGGSANAQLNEPCFVLVDVNGDRSPNMLTSDNAMGGELMDMFLIMITDRGAYPYGVLAQKILYSEN